MKKALLRGMKHILARLQRAGRIAPNWTACEFGVSVLNMRPVGHASPDGHGIVRRPILDDLPPPTIIIADIYGDYKSAFVRLLIDVITNFFREVGPQQFAVTTPERAKGVFDV
ncbi:hypothetical protein [Mesorhizobium sp. A623]